jgi:hypothetical protein
MVLSLLHAVHDLPTDLLRGKLSQLEHNVLAAAAAATPGSAAAGAAAAPGGPTPKQGAAAGSSSGALDLRSLLQSLGLGEEVVRGLAEMGVGPLGPAGGGQESEAGGQQQQEQEQRQGWQQAAGGSFRWAGCALGALC